MGGEGSGRGAGTVVRVTADPTRAATFERQIAVRTGYRVRTADSMGVALGHLDGEHSVVAVVADADLAGADGVALLEVVRAERPGLPVLLRTEDDGSRTIARAARAGVTRVLPAGVYDGAWETVARLLERAAAAGGRAAASGGRVAADRTSDQSATPGSELSAGLSAAEGRPDPTTTAAARAVLDGALDGIVVTVAGEVAYANRRATEAFDVRPGAPFRVGPSLEGLERAAGELSADGGREGGDGPRPVERRRTAIPGQGPEPTPVDLTAAGIRWEGAPATLAVVRAPGSVGDDPPGGRVDALEELLDRLRSDLGTLLGGTELLRDRVDERGRPHLESMISTAMGAVTRAETAGAVAGTLHGRRDPPSIELRPAIEGALETARASDPATDPASDVTSDLSTDPAGDPPTDRPADLVVSGSIPSVTVAADETLEFALASLLRHVAERDAVETVDVEVSLPESGTTVEVCVRGHEGGGGADPGTAHPAASGTAHPAAHGTVHPDDLDGSEPSGDEHPVSVLSSLLEDGGGRVRVTDDGTGDRTYVLTLPTAPVKGDRPVADGLRGGERD